MSGSLKVAFVGDTGVQTNGQGGKVMEMLVNERVDLVVQNGDFDYESDTKLWDDFLNLYPGIDFIVSSGNHEEQSKWGAKWYGAEGYQAKMIEHSAKSNLKLSENCSGDYGERYSCDVQGNQFVLIGWKQVSTKEEIEKSEVYLEKMLQSSTAKFKWCIWHKPEGRINNGSHNLGNYGMQGLYEICRKYGAVVTSGHVHVYGRTKLLSNFSGVPAISGNDMRSPIITCGETIALLVGMGGYRFDQRGKYGTENYWARQYVNLNSNRESPVQSGALICDVNESVANCEFKLLNRVWDSFTLTKRECSTSNLLDENSKPINNAVESENSNILLISGISTAFVVTCFIAFVAMRNKKAKRNNDISTINIFNEI